MVRFARFSLLVISMIGVGLMAHAADAPPPKPATVAPKDPPKAPVTDAKDPKKTEDPKAADALKKEEKTDINVVVSANRLTTEKEKTGVSTAVISKRDLQISQDVNLGEALRMVSGVTINQSGRLGDQQNVRIRGGEVDHALVLYDGFKVNHFGTTKAFQFDNLDPIGVQRVEVTKGGGSSLYGSEAVTGLVNLITEKGEGRPELTASGAYGTYATDRETLSIKGRQGKFSYNVSGSHMRRDTATPNNSGFENHTLAARLDYDFTENHALKFIMRGSNFKKGWYEHTATGFGMEFNRPDPNDKIYNHDMLTGLEYSGRPVPIWETALKVGYFSADTNNTSKDINPTFTDRTFPDFPFTYAADRSRVTTHERRTSADWQNNVTVFENENIKNVVTVGLYGEHQDFMKKDFFVQHVFAGFDEFIFDTRRRLEMNQDNWAVYYQNRLELFDRAFITLGGRHDDDGQFGPFESAHADVSVLIPESGSRIHGSVGRSYRAPSFFELKDNIFNTGNPSLKPERNFTYDMGFEQTFWNKKIRLDATFFHNEFDNLIVAGPAPRFRSINLQTAASRGWEFEASIKPVKQIELSANMTLLITEDQLQRELLRRVPRTYSAKAVFHPLLDLVPEKWSGLDISVEALGISARKDITMLPNGAFVPRAYIPGYLRADATISYRFFEHFRAFGRFENVFDIRYKDIATFPADGATQLGGIEFTWKF